jgi:transposase
MQTRKDRWQEDLFVASPLSSLIPDDHLFRRVDKVLDFSWLHEELRECYSQERGRPSIDPEAALRLMLAGFFEGIVHDRKLLRRAQTDLSFRWFAGYALHERLPEHSSLTRIRQRWGAERFRRIFEKTVEACMAAGLVNGQTVHIDASLIRANVSWKSITAHHVEQVVKANPADEEAAGNEASVDEEASADEEAPRRGRGRKPKAPKTKKVSKSDPEASLATSRSDYPLQPCYKQHTAVDDRAGVIVDVAVTTGEASEGQHLLPQLERVEALTGVAVERVTADAGYAHGTNYERLEQRKTEAVIPPPRGARRPKRIPARRFKYDARHQLVRCPAGKTLECKGRVENPGGWRYAARACDCAGCPLRLRCFSPSARVRTVVIPDGYEARLRARRRKERGWDEATREWYDRHRWRAEGAHGEAKTHHGLSRAVRRGTDNVAIQVYLTAAVMNLSRLARALTRPIGALLPTIVLPWPLGRLLNDGIRLGRLAIANTAPNRVLLRPAA